MKFAVDPVGLAPNIILYLWLQIRVLLLFYVCFVIARYGYSLYTRLSEPAPENVKEISRPHEISCQELLATRYMAALEETSWKPVQSDGKHDNVLLQEQKVKQKSDPRVAQKAKPAEGEDRSDQEKNGDKEEGQELRQSTPITMCQKLVQHILRFDYEQAQKREDDEQNKEDKGAGHPDMDGLAEEPPSGAQRAEKRHEWSRKKLQEAEALLNSTTLKKRAGPNQRLKDTFGIDNIFTTTDFAYYAKSRAKIVSSLTESNKAHKRRALRDAGVEVIRQTLRKQETHMLLRIVRVLVMQSVMQIFFPSLQTLPDHELDSLGFRVNLLWYASKNRSLDQDAINHVRQGLQGRLEAIFSANTMPPPAHVAYDRMKPRTNPLNVILPAYLGLFRATLRCFIEVQYRSSKDNRARWSSILCEYARNADSEIEDIAWKKGTEDLSAVHIVSETLRLYPSTSRMWVGDSTTQEPVGVDIEGIHRTHQVWGAKPLRFMPERWTKLRIRVNEEPAFIPFGRKRVATAVSGSEKGISMCPSRKTGGPRLIAVLVACLLETVGDWEISHGSVQDDVMSPGPLRKGVDAYESLRLRRPESQAL
ncbi:unnamed protein product [Diplocarpon coronariae]